MSDEEDKLVERIWGSDQKAPRIFLVGVRLNADGSVEGEALSEDGDTLATIQARNLEWLWYDFGQALTAMKPKFDAVYPGGWELLLVDKPYRDEAFRAAHKKLLGKQRQARGEQ